MRCAWPRTTRACARRPPSETRLPSGGGRRWRRRRRDRAGGLRSPRPAALVDRRRRRSSSRSRSRSPAPRAGTPRYRAQTLISLGTPFTATGGAAITSAFCTSPVAPATLIKQDAIRAAAERQAGLEAGRAQGPRLVAARARRRHEAQLHPGRQHHRAGAVQGRHDGQGRRRPGRRACRRPAASTRSRRAADHAVAARPRAEGAGRPLAAGSTRRRRC